MIAIRVIYLSLMPAITVALTVLFIWTVVNPTPAGANAVGVGFMLALAVTVTLVTRPRESSYNPRRASTFTN